MKLKRILQIALVLALSAMIFSVQVLALRTPGVDVGDTCRYDDIGFNWSSTDPNATPPLGIEFFNETEWIFAIVTDVSVPVVTVETITRLKNGTEETSGGYIDVDTGETENMTYWLIAANLGPGDPIYTSASYSTWIINETIPRYYQYETRDTNHLNIPYEIPAPPPPYIYLGYVQNYYWDKATGILTEMHYTFTNQTVAYLTTWSLWIRITESNVWVVPEFPTWTSILLVSAILAVSTVAYRRRLIKKPIQ